MRLIALLAVTTILFGQSVAEVTSENDPRVASWQSWKFAAALQSAASSQRPVIGVAAGR
jgi:hypothetical protein